MIDIKEIEPLLPFSRGTTEIFLTGHWSSKKPVYANKTSPCREACPIGNDISRAFAYAEKGDYDEALRIYRQENPLPGVCGRVCYHPCELSCNRKDFDEALNVRGFERFLADHGKVRPERPLLKRKEKAAVIGSGPAGLSAAYHLARLGYNVHIFEALPEAGGMLRYGIPEYRLPKRVLRKEIGFIRALGVEIATGVRVGKDIPLSLLEKDYHALFVAVGSHKGMTLGVEGDGLALQGIAFLRSVALGETVKIGARTAIIGGGNTAIDCARTARRLGAKDVSIVYRRSPSEMPALAEDVQAARAEGIALHFLTAPKRLTADKGAINLECMEMELGAPDGSGRARPVPIEGSLFTLKVDSVIAAVGQVPESDIPGLNRNERGLIENSPGVFVGGDCAGAKAFVADAIASGKQGALAIHCRLEGKDLKEEFSRHRIGGGSSFSFQHLLDPLSCPSDLKRVVTLDQLNTICVPAAPRKDSATASKIDSFQETARGLSASKMSSEVERCFKCGTCTQCDLCFLLCPDISLKKEEDGYAVNADYCKGCGVCATTCPRSVIDMRGGDK